MSKSRIFLRAMLAFVAGIGLRSFVPVSYILMWIAGLGAVAGVAVGVMRGHKKSVLYGFFVIVFLLGIFRFDLVEHSSPDIARFYGKPMALAGVVVEDPAMSGNIARVKVKILSVDHGAVPEPFFILITAKKYPAYVLGDELAINGVVERPENFSDFDYVSYLRRDNIFAVMAYPRIEKTGEGKGNRLMLVLSRIKHGFEANIDAALPEPHAAFMKGQLLGDRAYLPKDLTEDFKAAGVSHIVALSGYNITLVGKFVTRTLLFLAVPFVVSFWIAVSAIILFVLLTGAAASVVRAGIMGVLVLVAQKEGRMYQMTNALALAGTVMVFYQPYILRFDAGFQLSFLATMGLVYLAPYVERILDRIRAKLGARYQWEEERQRGRQKRVQLIQIRQSLVETLSAQLAVLPLLIVLFGRVSLVSPLTNIFVLIAVPYAMAVGFAAGVAGFLWSPIGVVAGWGAWVLLEYQLQVIRFFAHIPFASLEVGTWVLVPLCIAYAMLFWKIWNGSKNTQK